MMYVVTEWDERYEVNSKGDAYKDGDTRRQNPLSFVKLRVHGHHEGVGWKRLRRAVGDDKAFAAFGLFCKILELAADQTGTNRGKLLDEKGRPADADYIALVLSVPVDFVSEMLPALVGIGWIDSVPRDTPESSGALREAPGSSEIPSRTETETEEKRSEYKPKDSGNPQKAPKGTKKDNDSPFLHCPRLREKKSFEDTSASVSASERPPPEIKSKKVFLLRLHDVFDFPLQSSDHTAMRNLADALDKQKAKNPHVFSEVLAIAMEKIKCPSIRNAKAAFFAVVKSKYGFLPTNKFL